MHITRYTDYSLRVLMYLALKGEGLATIREIAESYDISKNHLMKVVQDLNNKGYLTAIRGKNGGVRLAGRPEDINLGHLVRDTEQDLALVECFSNGRGCVITPACELKRMFAEALEAFFKVLDQYTLADLLPQGKAKHMVRLLRIG
ncbi:RrF2 family transcriptional regulator [Microbulbifer rhizosphaerae]|uniref:Rrf2 family nitric oxide-sensitive transcriptional repressor n=1 Tax=Microbulbifer rhizosphaerae TaxID=1562603 RepID=A0A7W4W7R0_9GAMM|nr:Rrf2 family transcriptional regulator [Microbulbifer rhizosphaerae]MBB3059252.1 Rrf2 family nitric oxide-sensitive transcriptional repressor [Microbulbifer rhizosphaerae]